MHPAFIWWARHARNGGPFEGFDPRAGAWAGCGSGRRGPPDFEGRGPFGGHGHFAGHGHGPHDDGGAFGVRRPLRFLAHKLDLSEPQVAELARILDELKTERAQAEVDHRRTVAAFADAVEGAAFGEERAREGGDLRVKSAERLREAVTKALGKIHALLDDDQRKRLAYLVRTGVLSI